MADGLALGFYTGGAHVPGLVGDRLARWAGALGLANDGRWRVAQVNQEMPTKPHKRPYTALTGFLCG